MAVLRTRYAVTQDGVHIAYQAFGGGRTALVLIHPWISHVELSWELPGFRRLAEALARNRTVIHFDKRGVGLSDRIASIPTFEARIDDVLAVLDAEHVERAALFGYGDGAALAAAFAATHPRRTSCLVLNGDSPFSSQKGTDNPGGTTREDFDEIRRLQETIWGDPTQGAAIADLLEGPGSRLNDDPAFGPRFAKLMRYASSPGDVRMIDRIWFETDASGVIDALQVPTALYYRPDWPSEIVDAARRFTTRIPGARLLEVPGAGGFAPWAGDVEALASRIGDFLDELESEEATLDRVLATVLFTDIVGSTEKLAAAGDRAWKLLVEDHHRRTRALLARYRGREVDTAGDGFVASFDGPGRAVRCALALLDAMRHIDVDVRAGLHTGEVEEIAGKIGGLAVHIAARVAAHAGAGEVVVTGTVKDLVAGSGLEFADAGEHKLKGVPGVWRLYRVA